MAKQSLTVMNCKSMACINQFYSIAAPYVDILTNTQFKYRNLYTAEIILGHVHFHFMKRIGVETCCKKVSVKTC